MTKKEARAKLRARLAMSSQRPFSEEWWDREIDRAVGLRRNFVIVKATDTEAVEFFESKGFKVTPIQEEEIRDHSERPPMSAANKAICRERGYKVEDTKKFFKVVGHRLTKVTGYRVEF